jgi:uncharacterized protein YjgD (DUF1641 family)
MTNKEKVEKDIELVKAAIEQLKEDIELLADEERAELKDKINAALAEYTDEIEAIKEFDRTLIEKIGKHGRTFLYIVVGILAITGIDKAIGWVKGLF